MRPFLCLHTVAIPPEIASLQASFERLSTTGSRGVKQTTRCHTENKTGPYPHRYAPEATSGPPAILYSPSRVPSGRRLAIGRR